MKAPRITSNEFSIRERALKNEVIRTIRSIIGRKKIDLVEMDNCFTDEANNEITGFNRNVVFFDGTMESYPLGEVGLLDAIQILNIIENY